MANRANLGHFLPTVGVFLVLTSKTDWWQIDDRCEQHNMSASRLVLATSVSVEKCICHARFLQSLLLQTLVENLFILKNISTFHQWKLRPGHRSLVICHFNSWLCGLKQKPSQVNNNGKENALLKIPPSYTSSCVLSDMTVNI